MTALTWDAVGERVYETGVDHGVLYIPDAGGAYIDGVAWNGLTNVSESPSGGEANPQYADNIKYLNLISAEEFSATLEAFTYPEEFNPFDGLGSPSPGVYVAQQNRGVFGLSYRTLIGNDLQGTDYGYKIHLVYGCQASPSEKAHATVNESPEAVNFSWEISTTPVAAPAPFKPTAHIIIDSTTVDATALAALEQILYGDVGVDPALPLPAAVFALFDGSFTVVTPNAPTYVDATDTLTIPVTAGVTYYIDGDPVVAGDIVITEDTLVTARPNDGYVFTPGVDDDWFFNHTP